MPGEGVIAPFSTGVVLCFCGVAEALPLPVPFPLLPVQAVTNTISPRNIHILHKDRRIESFFIRLYLCSKSTSENPPGGPSFPHYHITKPLTRKEK
jgi:hypothetical protein